MSASDGSPAGPRVMPQPAARTRVLTRRAFLRRTGTALAAALLAPVLAGCSRDAGEGTLIEARRQGFIRVGMAGEEPYGYVDSAGRATGAAPEVAREVLRRLGVPRLDPVVTTFGSLIPDLLAGRFDVIAAGMFITADRCDRIIFSDPDSCTLQAFLVPAGNPRRITRYADIAADPDLVLGVLTGAVEGAQAREAGVPDDRTLRFDSNEALLDAVRTGLVDAGALTTLAVGALTDGDRIEGVEATAPFAHRDQPGCSAFGFRPDDVHLRDEFDRILRELRAEGRLTKIVEPYGLADAARAAAGVTAEAICQPADH